VCRLREHLFPAQVSAVPMEGPAEQGQSRKRYNWWPVPWPGLPDEFKAAFPVAGRWKTLSFPEDCRSAGDDRGDRPVGASSRRETRKLMDLVFGPKVGREEAMTVQSSSDACSGRRTPGRPPPEVQAHLRRLSRRASECRTASVHVEQNVAVCCRWRSPGLRGRIRPTIGPASGDRARRTAAATKTDRFATAGSRDPSRVIRPFRLPAASRLRPIPFTKTLAGDGRRRWPGPGPSCFGFACGPVRDSGPFPQVVENRPRTPLVASLVKHDLTVWQAAKGQPVGVKALDEIGDELPP